LSSLFHPKSVVLLGGKRYLLSFRLLPLLACLLLLSGCHLPTMPSLSSLSGRITNKLSRMWPKTPVIQLKAPPYIPLAPIPSVDPTASGDEQDREAGFYSDLPSQEMAPGQNAPPLREALVQAILFRILRPSGPQDRFRPNRGVLYGEIRRWIIAYQTILTSAVRPVRSPEDETEASTPGLARGLGSRAAADGTERKGPPLPIVPPVWQTPPSDLVWNGHTLPENIVPTREELMTLYVFLTGQEGATNSLSTDSLESVVADGAEPGMEESLGQVKDYAAISPWARSTVAIAYRDRIPQVVFGLTPARLTLTDGLLPQKTVTRAEVILLLYHLYGEGLSHLDPHNLLLHGPQVQAAEAAKQEASGDKSGKAGTGSNPNGTDILNAPLTGKAAARKPDKDALKGKAKENPSDPFSKPSTDNDAASGKKLDALQRLQKGMSTPEAPETKPTPTEKSPEKSPRGVHSDEVRQILRIDAPE
jgi:hypothetical protein